MTRPGFALFAALWFVVAISGLLLGISLTAHERTLAAANIRESIRATAAARAGIADVQAHLQDAIDREGSGLARNYSHIPGDPWSDVGNHRGDSLSVGNAHYVVTERDAGTLVNLNRISEDELRQFLIALQVDAGRANEIAESVLDWRDRDDSRRARGAERADYIRKGSIVLPRDGDFRDLGELRSVNGVTEADYDRVWPYLTLVGSGTVNLNVADRPVLMSLPGMTEGMADAIVRAQHRSQPLRSFNDLANLLPLSERDALTKATPSLLERVTFVTREVEVRSVGEMNGSPVRVAIIALMVRGSASALLVSHWIDE